MLSRNIAAIIDGRFRSQIRSRLHDVAIFATSMIAATPPPFSPTLPPPALSITVHAAMPLY